MAFNDNGNRFQRTTPAVLNLLIINGIAFVAQLMFGGISGKPTDLFALHHYKSDYFQWYQVITHMFMHGSILHLLFNMYALWMFGTILERVWGPKRFLLFYFACGIGAAIVQLASYAYSFRMIYSSGLSPADIQEVFRLSATVGASGAIMGLLVAFGYLFPNTEMMIIPIPVPVKAKWLVTGIVLIDLFSGVAGSPGDDVAHFAHVGGAVTGFLIVYIQNKTNKKTFY